ncbi:unnamed protein product [Gongylonema pulchrum]|uniref:MEIOC protein n=1 Tax=Gongylonema pulchrum TaxID=637853 RepID=A0A183E0U6_9BILA|nr:unnamed protein product [Gongylonema pulchrum]
MPEEFSDAQLTREKHEFFRNHLSLIPVHSNHAPLSLSATTSSSVALPSDFFITPFLQQQRYPESEPGNPAEHTAAFCFKFPATVAPDSPDSSDSRRSQIQLQKHSVFDDKIDLLYKSPFVTPADPKVAGAAVMADQAGKMEVRPTFLATAGRAVRKFHSAVPLTYIGFIRRWSKYSKLFHSG